MPRFRHQEQPESEISDNNFEDILSEKNEELPAHDVDDQVKPRNHIYWSAATKAAVLKKLQTNDILKVFEEMKMRIPIRTLFQWKKSGQVGRKKGSGRKVTSEVLDSALFR